MIISLVIVLLLVVAPALLYGLGWGVTRFTGRAGRAARRMGVDGTGDAGLLPAQE